MSELSKEDELRRLMMAGLKGDSAAHHALLSSLGGYLRGYYRGRLARAGRGPEEIEDLVQEALIAVHSRRHTYDPGEPLTPWIYAIARYKLIDHLRQTRVSTMHIPIEDAEEIIAKDDRTAVESSLDLAKLLARLPDRVRLPIQYVKIEGLSILEAAERCGISPSAIKINVHRGLKVLTAIVAQEKKR